MDYLADCYNNQEVSSGGKTDAQRGEVIWLWFPCGGARHLNAKQFHSSDHSGF